MKPPHLTLVVVLSLVACKRRGIDPPEPAQPVDTALARRPLPDAASTTPDAASTTPDAASTTPDAASTAPDAAAIGTSEPGRAPESLTAGRHRCALEEGGRSHALRCEVSAQSDGALEVEARARRGQGFRLTATGSAPRYRAQGTATTSGACAGEFAGELALGEDSRRPHYVIRWGNGCVITIQM